jgi:ABC-type lipopolysaccharide export system ATPase subunit
VAQLTKLSKAEQKLKMESLIENSIHIHKTVVIYFRVVNDAEQKLHIATDPKFILLDEPFL